MRIIRSILIIPIIVIIAISCGKPTDPESLNPGGDGDYKIVNRYETSGFAQDLVIKDGLAYIAQGEVGLMIVDVMDPLNPSTVSMVSDNVRGYSSKIAMKDSVVFLAAGSFGVTVLNVIDPSFPIVTASNLSMKPAKNLHVMGDYLFTAISEQGVSIAAIAYPAYPDIRGTTKTSGYAQGITTTSDSSKLLVACGEMGLQIFDISDLQQGFGQYQQLALCNTPGYAEEVTINGNESIAFLACGTAGLQIIDFSDTSNVHIVSSYDSGGYAKDLAYGNQRIYLSTELRGVQIVDVSDVTKPTLIGIVDTEYALGIDIDENYIYVADEDEGLIIISIPL